MPKLADGASFWHYIIMNDLYDEGYINEGQYLEFIDSHTGVVNQMPYSDLNPYYLGFNIFMDIKRICENPTEEDRKWFPDIAGTDWIPVVKNIAENYKDSSFVLQFLSPKCIRDMKLFCIKDLWKNPNLEVIATHADEQDYRLIRKVLADQLSISYFIPEINVFGHDKNDERELVLFYEPHYKEELDNNSGIKVLKYIYDLWGYTVILHLLPTSDDEKIINVRFDHETAQNS